MKNIFFLLSTLIIASCSTRTTVVEFPESETNLPFMSVYKVETSGKQTIVHGNVYNDPRAWVIVSSEAVLKGRNSGNSYKLLRAEGISLDHQLVMSESGTMPFTLYFEPVSAGDTIVDLIEFRENAIKGLKLTKSDSDNQNHTIITGTIEGRPSASRIIIYKNSRDLAEGRFISIPVTDGKFTYDLASDAVENYYLTIWSRNGQGDPLNLLSEPGEVTITYYPRSADVDMKAEASSPLNKKLFDYRNYAAVNYDPSAIMAEVQSLQQSGKLYTPEILREQEKISKIKNEQDRRLANIALNAKLNSGEGLSETALALFAQDEKMRNDLLLKELEIIDDPAADLAGYTLLYQRIAALTARAQRPRGVPAMLKQPDIAPYETVYREVYAVKYPDHPFTAEIARMLKP